MAGIRPVLDSQSSEHRGAVAASGARPSPDRERERIVDPKDDGALLERGEASIAEIEELRPLLAEARERGFVPA